MSKLVRFTLLYGVYLSMLSCQDKKAVETSLTADWKTEATTLDSAKILESDSVLIHKDTPKLSTPQIPIIDHKAEPSEIQDEVTAKEESCIIRGSVTSTFYQKLNQLFFQSSVTEDQDPRIGCSGGGNLLNFVIPFTGDSFSYENEKLRTLQLKYRIDGGMFFATGKNPKKGKIAGRKKDDSTWIVEMDILVPMHSDQRQQEERPIKRKIEFSKDN